MVIDRRQRPAGELMKGDRLWLRYVPSQKPSKLEPGWHEVLELGRDPKDQRFVQIRVLPAAPDERNDLITVHEEHEVTVERRTP